MTDQRPNRSMSPEADARFERELGRAARSLVTEDLPRGVLDGALDAEAGLHGVVRGRRPVPVFAGVVAILVVLLASAIVLAPGGFPPASPSASARPSPVPSAHGAFRATLDMRADFMRLRYGCGAGSPLPSVAPGSSSAVREGVICTAPADAGPYVSVVIVSEAADGRPVEVHVKADLTADDTPATRGEVAVPIAKAAAIGASGQDVGNALAQWVLANVPPLEPSTSVSTEILGFSLQLLRNPNGGYQLFIHAA
jgi:hypothetical protein